MTEPTTGLGRPVWVDLSTSDPAAARAFYATLLRWDIDVTEDPQFGFGWPAEAKPRVAPSSPAGTYRCGPSRHPALWVPCNAPTPTNS